MADFRVPRCANPSCGKPLPPKGRRGPAKLYCDEACKQAAWRYRRRMGAIVEPLDVDQAELEAADGSGPPPESLLRPVPTDEQVARAVLEARGLAFQFIRLGREARPEFALRCTRVGDAIRGAIDTNFKEAVE